MTKVIIIAATAELVIPILSASASTWQVSNVPSSFNIAVVRGGQVQKAPFQKSTHWVGGVQCPGAHRRMFAHPRATFCWEEMSGVSADERVASRGRLVSPQRTSAIQPRENTRVCWRLNSFTLRGPGNRTEIRFKPNRTGTEPGFGSRIWPTWNRREPNGTEVRFRAVPKTAGPKFWHNFSENFKIFVVKVEFLLSSLLQRQSLIKISC